MRNKSGKAALLVAVLALLSSLAGFSPAAGFIITSSKQIKPGVVLSSDIHKNGVRDSDIAGNAVTGSDVSPSAIGTTDIAEGGVTTGDIGADQVTATDIGANQVTPESVEAPEPEEEILTGGTVEATSEFAPTPLVGHYTKEDPTSILSVEWNGSAHAAFSGCVFQLRVNGQAPSPGQGGGEVFVAASSTWSGSTSALFDGLGTGTVAVEVWAKATIGGSTFPCTVGPEDTIRQALAISEIIV
jgi:hypothetical protein